MLWVQQPVVPQMTPWQRVLAYLESQGISFQTIASCHFDTRRDVLKQVFLPKESLLRAQAEVDWMKAKANAAGTSSGPSMPPRHRSRSPHRQMGVGVSALGGPRPR